MIFDDVFMLSIFLFVFLEHYRHMEKQYNILTWIVLFSGRRNMIFACNRPERENKLTIKFQVVSPSPLGFKFQYCNDYYLVGKYSFILQLVYFCVRHVLYHVCLTACLRFTCSFWVFGVCYQLGISLSKLNQKPNKKNLIILQIISMLMFLVWYQQCKTTLIFSNRK